MSVTYNYSADWLNRDTLPPGDTKKTVKAADFEAEWLAIKAAFQACAPTASPTFTGTVTFETVNATGTVSGSNINDTNWDTAYTAVAAKEANWDVAYTAVNAKEANWDAAYTSVNANELAWNNTALTVTTKESNWDAAYTAVAAKESVWDGKVEEAPINASQYARSNGAWVLVETDSGGVQVTPGQVANWDTAYGWGDHATAGYLTAYTETDPTVPAHVKAITALQVTNWDAAYSWGDHAAAGYALDANVPSNTGVGATGTWGISISGNAATATTATNATNATNATTANSAATADSATTAANCTGNSATATTATTASNCTRQVVAGTNLTGGGALTANRTINLVDSPSVTSLVLGNFTLIDSGTNLYVQYNGANVLRITSTGELVAEGDVTGFGTA